MGGIAIMACCDQRSGQLNEFEFQSPRSVPVTDFAAGESAAWFCSPEAA